MLKGIKEDDRMKTMECDECGSGMDGLLDSQLDKMVWPFWRCKCYPECKGFRFHDGRPGVYGRVMSRVPAYVNEVNDNSS